MWTITIGDVWLRRRQFVIAMVGASLVFATRDGARRNESQLPQGSADDRD